MIPVVRKVGLLSQRSHVILCLLSVVSFNSTNVERTLLLLVTVASDLLLRIMKLCSLLFIVVFRAAGCDKQNSLMRDGLCGKLHGRPSQLLFALHQSTIR